ncbi:unnamed protein product [Chrysoparadoxa australica]
MVAPKQNLFNHKAVWRLVDAKGQVVGRLASQLAYVLTGKHKPTYAPNIDCGDHLVVVNAKDVVFTGNKWKQKTYKWHTGYPGGLRTRTAEAQLQKKPEEVLRHAVSGMLPKNRMRARQMKKLHLYAGPSHPHKEELEGVECMLTDEPRSYKL